MWWKCCNSTHQEFSTISIHLFAATSLGGQSRQGFMFCYFAMCLGQLGWIIFEISTHQNSNRPISSRCWNVNIDNNSIMCLQSKVVDVVLSSISDDVMSSLSAEENLKFSARRRDVEARKLPRLASFWNSATPFKKFYVFFRSCWTHFSLHHITRETTTCGGKRRGDGNEKIFIYTTNTRNL